MNPVSKISTGLVLFTLLFMGSLSYGQMQQYRYKRELKGVSAQWHKLILDNDIFGKLSNNLADIRIFGITQNGDTIEAPYLLRSTEEKVLEKEITFRTFNVSYNDKGSYFTFEVREEEPVNEIRLDFGTRNFDWLVKLEGSQDQKNWFTITDKYRILSIHNGQTDFQFTRLVFPESRYRFFRLSVNSTEKPKLVSTSIMQRRVVEGRLRDYPVREMNVHENRELRRTEIDLRLPLPVPVSQVKIGVADSFDYYRPVVVQALTDSVKTEQGWRYNFVTLLSGTLNSLEKNELRFGSTTAQRLKILIDNQHNQPLHIDTVQVKGGIYELVARFTQPATYYLVYGNKSAGKPGYDISFFEENIPSALTALEAGAERKIQEDGPAPIPLFANKLWLWAVMAVIIVTLGWFSVKMMRKRETIDGSD